MTFKTKFERILVIFTSRNYFFFRNYQIIVNKKYLSIIPISHDFKSTTWMNTSHIYLQKLPFFQKLWDYCGQKIFIDNPNFTWPKNQYLNEWWAYLFKKTALFLKIMWKQRKTYLFPIPNLHKNPHLQEWWTYLLQKTTFFLEIVRRMEKIFFHNSKFT